MFFIISIILPVLPPEPYLPKLLGELASYVHVPYEVLIQTEKGLGYAVMCGVQRARGEVLVICDADGSHNPGYIPKMLSRLAMGDCSIVIGSRYTAGGSTEDSLSRQLISRVYCLFAQILFGLSIKDNMSGFIAARKIVFETYPIKTNGFKFGLQLLCKSKNVFKAVEYPICFATRKAGKSKASPKEAVGILFLLLKMRVQIKGKI